MATGGSEIYDKNAIGKKNFLRKFGRRMGNVFTRKRSRGEAMDEIPGSAHQLGPPSGDSSGVVINPLMASELPAASTYQSSRSHPNNGGAEMRPKGGGAGGAKRLSAEFAPVSSAISRHGEKHGKTRHASRKHERQPKTSSVESEESVTGAGPPPERCLSEGNLVESSPPRADQLGGLGGRIWRVVPGSMDNLPKALQSELSNKINSRAQSMSEDEGLPHSPTDTIMTDERSTSRIRTASQNESRSERPSSSLGGPTILLSQSSRSLISCDGTSDGEASANNLLDLDFNALRRAESLDNTAAKHKIQVSRPRKSRSSSHMAGGLRKHKSMSTVQLSGISEEVSAPSSSKASDALASSDGFTSSKTGKRSSAATQLALELSHLQKDRARISVSEKKEEKKVENQEKKGKKGNEMKVVKKTELNKTVDKSGEDKTLPEKKIGSTAPPPSKSIPIIRPARPVSAFSAGVPVLRTTPTTSSSAATANREANDNSAASKVTRLRSMFGSASITSDSAVENTKPTPGTGNVTVSASFSATQSVKPRGPPTRSATSTESKPGARFFSTTNKTSATTSVNGKDSKQSSGAVRTSLAGNEPKSADSGPTGSVVSSNILSGKTFGASSPPSSPPVRASENNIGLSKTVAAPQSTPKPKLSTASRQLSFPDSSPSASSGGTATSGVRRFGIGEKKEKPESTLDFPKVSTTKAQNPVSTDKNISSNKPSVQLREKKTLSVDVSSSTGVSADASTPKGRPVSKVMDLVRNFQRLQDTSSS